MESKKIQKINVLYLLAYIFVPIAICAICFLISYLFFPIGNMAVILLMGPSTLSLLWWIFGGKLIYKQKQKKMEKELDQKGFVRNHTFQSDGCVVMVDVAHGGIALLFFWNPFQPFILPANRISKVWVDDGRGGKGFMEGSSRVSFLFQVDGVKIRVNTFTSNKRWRMDSDYILTGISKADVMAEVLETARKQAG